MLTTVIERVNSLVSDDGVLGDVLRSGIWASLANIIGRGLQFLKLGVLTWLLSPTQFGLVGYALLTLAAVRRMSTLGLDQALIEKKADDVDEFLDVAWTLRVVRGFVLAGVIFLIAPFVAGFFSAPEAGPLVKGIAVIPILKGFENPGRVYFRKQLNFDKQFIYIVGRAVVGVVVAITAAFILGNAWALVLGTIAGRASALVLSYAIHPYRPQLNIDREQIRDLLGYGKWITLSGIVVYLINEGDDAFVGWFIGAGALGFYQVAYRFSNAPATEITKVVSSVVFPAYAKVQDDTETLRRGFFKTVEVTTFLSFPAAVGIIVVAPTFAETFLRPKWSTDTMVMLFQILALWGLLRSLGATTGPLFQAVGKPDLATKIQLGKLAIIAVLIYPATEAYGVAGTAGVIVVNSLFFSEPVAGYLAVREVDGEMRELLALIGYPLVASAVMGGAVFWVRETAGLSEGILAFSALVLVGVGSYALSTLVLTRWFGYDLLTTIRTMTESLST
ncbi:lipopolysaccharide biosynthesis protein [Halorussus halophilus]|uniref:lipopolysaccharide biosynthesis protein n=1 Tax=Halorussus halophilus TaxID=2650975 RepID=UPI001CE3CEA8|nr:lipopolysaccharide biosynthesis protein [Halorussus halophilus]